MNFKVFCGRCGKETDAKNHASLLITYYERDIDFDGDPILIKKDRHEALCGTCVRAFLSNLTGDLI